MAHLEQLTLVIFRLFFVLIPQIGFTFKISLCERDSTPWQSYDFKDVVSRYRLRRRYVRVHASQSQPASAATASITTSPDAVDGADSSAEETPPEDADSPVDSASGDSDPRQSGCALCFDTTRTQGTKQDTD